MPISAKKRLTAACPVFPQSVDFLATRVESHLDSNTVGDHARHIDNVELLAVDNAICICRVTSSK
jgi:hypothetical protein